MRPIELIMSAFGSYGNETRIDFSNLKGEVFLITGDTGAGKTTIFDAVMFALYGRTSGGERAGSMMRSQFAMPDRKTFVRYRFALGEAVYEITRNPEYTMEVTLKNGTKKTRKISQNVELVLPDKSVFPGKKGETDAKIEELTGLSGEQFTQMAMIAQGDFLKLIYAKTDERKKIFTKLFGTGIYTRIEEELRRCSQEMDARLVENARAYEQEFARRMCPDGMAEDEEAAPLVKLEAYIACGRQQEKELKEQYTSQSRDFHAITERISKAEIVEKMFASLAAAQGQQEAYQAQRSEIEMHRQRLSDAKQADTVQQAELRAEEIKTRLEENRENQEKLKELLEDLEISVKRYQEVRNWIELQLQAEQYKKITAALKEYEKQQAVLEEKRNVWVRITEESVQFGKIYEDKYLIFLQEQAGILAEGLKADMPCPVCGSIEHPAPAKLSEQAVSEEEVKQAKADRERAEKQRQEAENQYRFKEEEQKRQWQEITEKLAVSLKQNPANFTEAKAAVETALLQCGQRIEECRSLFADSGVWQTYYHKFQRKLSAVKETPETLFEAMAKEAEQMYQKLLSQQGSGFGEQKTRQELEKELSRSFQEERKNYEKLLKKAGFADEEAYHSCLLSQKEQKLLEEQISGYEQSCQKNEVEIQTLKQQLRGKKRLPMEELKAERKELYARQKQTNRLQQTCHTINVTNEQVKAKLLLFEEERKKLQKEDDVIKSLFKTANGKLTQSAKMDFETYVQRQYFRQIIRQANRRFLVMTNQQFMLQIKEEMTGKGKNEGLDLLVYSLVTGSLRDIKTLSGGESFLAALSMALGLSDIVKQNAGGIRLDMMFIDEGFGSLDGESQKKAIEVLEELSDGKRMIGIISHVTELKEQLDKKLVVTRNEKGSSICWENS